MKWSFWKWFFLGLTDSPGILKFVDWWLPIHVLIAAILSTHTNSTLKDEAVVLILPLAGVFVGLTFAWSGNAQALMQTDDLAQMFKHHPDGLANYIYTFQTAVLCLLATILGWGIAGLGVFDVMAAPNLYTAFGIKFALFLMSSLSVRECWHVILGSQFLVLALQEIRQNQGAKSDDKKD